MTFKNEHNAQDSAFDVFAGQDIFGDENKTKPDTRNYRVIPLVTERMERGGKTEDLNSLNVLARISLASPANILTWSHRHRSGEVAYGLGGSPRHGGGEIGEVRKADTINYRTFKPEREGLFCERIFGPQKDWECSCGKYKKQKYKGITCEKCGVEVIESKVRRHRMGHIKLAAPVCHIWFYRGTSSRVAQLLDMNIKDVTKIVNFQTHVVISIPPNSDRDFPAPGALIADEDVNRLRADGGRITFNSDKEQHWYDELTFIDSRSESELYDRQHATSDAGAKQDRWALTIMSGAAAVRCLLIMLELGAKTVEEALTKLCSTNSMSRDAAYENVRSGLGNGNEMIRRSTKLLGKSQAETIDEAMSLLVDDATGNPPGLDQLYGALSLDMRKEKSTQRRAKITKRLKVVDSFRGSRNMPHWMIMEVLPVIPPDLRPLINLDGGRFATSDMNELYCRVIHRNNRLKKLMELRAPEVIARNEKRMLQDAVDALFDNVRCVRPAKNRGNNHVLRSLSDMLKGKQGRFRQNLLGKRVDYSGRSVIVVGPELQFNQCGIPKKMALELFEPFVVRELKRRGYVATPKAAKKKIEAEEAVVYEILEDVIKGHPVLLNRAPTLHRLGIQAFFPKLVEGKAIQLHPMSCAAFNADFDGDQMAVHVPLSTEAKLEAVNLMLAQNNILSLANGGVIASPSQDMVLGLYYLNKWHVPGSEARYASVLTKKKVAEQADELHAKLEALMVEFTDAKQCLKPDFDFKQWHRDVYASGDKARIDFVKCIPVFANAEMCLQALQQEAVTLQELVFVGLDMVDGSTKIMPTTPGRVEFRKILPPKMRAEIDFLSFGDSTVKGKLASIAENTHKAVDREEAARVLDAMKTLGYRHAKRGGLSIGLHDMKIPTKKDEILKKATDNSTIARNNYRNGVITEDERYRRIVHEWSVATDVLTEEVKKTMKYDRHGLNSVWMMANSGARGNMAQVRQLTGMRGLMQKPTKKVTGGIGEVIESPITSNFREGLSVLEYFISTHGARKGLADTALKTSDAGYLTRRLVDVAQDVFVTELDCHTTDFIEVEAIKERTQTGYRELEPLRDRLAGRVAAEDVYLPEDGSLAVRKNVMIDNETAAKIDKAGTKSVKIRSVLTCKTGRGVCAACYGRNMSTGDLVEPGEAVGVISAQSIGEPGTQLTLRTFHIGGAANITAEGWYQSDKPGTVKFINVKTLTMPDGTVKVCNRDGHIEIHGKGVPQELPELMYGSYLRVTDGQEVKPGDRLADWDPHNLPIMSEAAGSVYFGDITPDETIAADIDTDTDLVTYSVTESRYNSRRPSLIVVSEADGEKSYKVFALSTGTTLSQLFNRMPEERDPRNVAIEESLAEKFGFEKVRQVFKTGGKKGEALRVVPGDVLAQIANVGGAKSKDITGGLPRVEELFEARKPKDAAIVAEETGVFHLRGTLRGSRRAVVETDDKREFPVTIPGNRHLLVHDGERVTKGTVLTDGTESPHDVLRIKGRKALMEFLVTEVQQVYRLQNVKINDKHIECIVRQMLKKRTIDEVGDTRFLFGQQVSEGDFVKENARVEADGGHPAKGTPKLLGLTKASLETESFISAASFQETTKVLADSAVRGRLDYLRGLKENIIMGLLIPAGTGLPEYRHAVVGDPDEMRRIREEEEAEEDIMLATESQTLFDEKTAGDFSGFDFGTMDGGFEVLDSDGNAEEE